MSSPPNNSQQGAPPINGQRLGDYLILEAIGKGSFGKVKRGVHVPSGQAVAIKILNRQKLKSANMDKKIRREIKILKIFRHPNVCRLYEVITTASDIFLIMEHVDGGELYDYIVKQGKLREDAARYIFQQIVCALEYCHHFRVVHRDLKPENILLGANLQVKLIDFGLSNLMEDGDFLATSCGSPNYAAPEVISGKLYHGPEVDVWSCGVILYALLCGCLPFDEETIPLLFSKIKKGKYTVPSHVSQGAKALLEQVLAVDPLIRLTVPQIRDNLWFNGNLPLHLVFNEAAFKSNWDRASAGIVEQVKNLMNAKDKDIRNQIEAGEGRLYVAYQILFDVKRRSDIAESLHSEGLQTTGSTFTLAAPGRATACQRELNMGLVLSMSPAMEVLLDSGDAASNKSAYNSGTYLPASVQQDPSKMALCVTPSSAGTFSISRPSTSVSSGGGLLSSSHQRSVAIGSLRAAAGPSGLSTSMDKPPRIGSVARTQQMYTAQEEAFILQNNFGWRVGLMTNFRGPAAMDVLYDVLKGLGFEWKMAAQFRLLLRQVGAPKTGGIVLSLYLFRIQERHDKGSILDLSVVRGNTFEALDLILAVVEKIHERIG